MIIIIVRNATIKTITDTHLAYMEKIGYERTLKSIEEKNIEKFVMFLRTLPLFADWNRVLLLKIRYFIQKVEYIRNSIIYHEGGKPTKVYIVVKGEFQESCKISLDEDLSMLSEKDLKRKFSEPRSKTNSRKYLRFPQHLKPLHVNFLL